MTSKTTNILRTALLLGGLALPAIAQEPSIVGNWKIEYEDEGTIEGRVVVHLNNGKWVLEGFYGYPSFETSMRQYSRVESFDGRTLEYSHNRHVVVELQLDGDELRGSWRKREPISIAGGPTRNGESGTEVWKRIPTRIEHAEFVVPLVGINRNGSTLVWPRMQKRWNEGPLWVGLLVKGQGAEFDDAAAIDDSIWFPRPRLEVSPADTQSFRAVHAHTSGEKGGVLIHLQLLPGIQPGRKVFFLNGEPFEAQLEFQDYDVEPDVVSVRDFRIEIVGDDGSRPSDCVRLGDRVRIVARFAKRLRDDRLTANLSSGFGEDRRDHPYALYATESDEAGGVSYVSNPILIHDESPGSAITSSSFSAPFRETLTACLGEYESRLLVIGDPGMRTYQTYVYDDGGRLSAVDGVEKDTAVVFEVVFGEPMEPETITVTLRAGGEPLRVEARRIDAFTYRTDRFVPFDEGVGHPPVPAEIGVDPGTGEDRKANGGQR